VRERTRLAHQPVDDVPVVDLVPVAAPQPWHLLHALLPIPHLQVLRVHAHRHLFADQAARHRVAVPAHVNQAAAIHAALHELPRFQPSRRQRAQHLQLFRQPHTPARVLLAAHRLQKLPVLLPAREIPTAPQQQRLLHRLFETAMPLLRVAVLVRVVRLDLLAHQPIVIQQGLIAARELLPVGQVVHGGAHAVPLRHTAQFAHGVLQALAQRLEALRETNGHRFPVRIGQHKVVDQVVERLRGDGDAQLVHDREVRSTQPARLVNLGEEHLLGRARTGPPAPDVALQRPQLTGLEAPWVAPLQFVEEGLGLQPGAAFQQCPHLGPDRGERVGPGPPGVRLGHLAG
jgi:hypothetical protein